MEFQSPLYKGFLVKRCSAVLADVGLESGDLVTAYCSNTSKMKGLDIPQSEVFLSFNRKENRRLLYTWEIVSADGTLVGVNMSSQGPLVLEAIENGSLYELGGYAKNEKIVPPMDSSFLDLKLTAEEGSGYPVCKVAIAPAYLKRGTDVLFPDGIDVANHHVLKQLEDSLMSGERAVLLILAQRIDCIGIKADWTADAAYILKLKELCDKGLEIICCGCSVSPDGIWIAARLPFMF